ncbi:hypothetical protein ICQ_05784 [Bacillus toyonensis]|nr:hypothetical protein ICQ_05784 [Bacillus toyonensis]
MRYRFKNKLSVLNFRNVGGTPSLSSLEKQIPPKRKNKPFSIKNTRNFHPGGVIKFLS